MACVAYPRRRIAGLVLAAGPARRFGAPKQLACLDGRPLLEHVLAAMAAVPQLSRVVVTLGAHAAQVQATIDLHGAQPVVIEEWIEGQAASLRRGVATLADADAVVVVLGDQPHIDAPTIARTIAAWDGTAPAVRATYGGRPGHPVLIDRELFEAMAALRGDVGARQLLARHEVIEVPCGEQVVRDIDTREQLAALTRRTAGRVRGLPAARRGARRT